MLKRYGRDEMSNIWSEANKFFNWLLVEIAVLKARRRIGEFIHEIPSDLAEKISIQPEEINRIEREITKHDVVAFLTHISPQFPGELRPWLHRGLTSYDIGDTALSLQLRESVSILIQISTKLMSAIKTVAMEYKYTPEIGRTHGIHAEPITFGVKLANWYDELNRHIHRLQRLLVSVSVGKISGAVGMYTIDPKIEEMVCEDLGLRPIIATQIISRDIVAEYMSTLGIIAATIGKFSTNLRLLSQTEIGEIMELFGKDQKGSSAMPHKENPIGSENLSGLMRVVCSNVQVAYENLAACWHERSLDNSGSERVIIADSSILLDYAMARLAGIIEKMRVFPGRMTANLNQTKGLIFSQEVMMLVAEKSKMPREEAHTLVRDVALECWENGTDFLEVLLGNNSIIQFVSEDELRSCFNLENKVRYVDYIFAKSIDNQNQEGGNEY
ncbi:MAG: Adenylosuccinate lyase [Candidatus Azambacteria bacterium GW2011_GWE1_42_9]|nr:MAG: Adenylosuccinate lyase [Candidatus Azambacteria bacterium GW2011_GWF1_41_10]KKS49334.1 MAG: Adenylosuccinate lyase [Candidatus Azambacteria bacterium GW2011_GWF2_42_22]KKS79825.1 MAG: Adenylosuccinate lyase [Candidatus Azambacteria bacterium GW2011_GWE1_42_9]KKT03445.1 MAG: Adenylosuccinate lyase [Candidatus Azambacteria bacterium GW2011_GWD1_43_18]KKT12473.1 MAG: Adenylosuccinate lyase [Candidatus Azambacteria bacterium GW2011_GWC2_43_27]KKT16263.1 MAG: Adenylosuccinate lyase [Parcuba